MTNQSELEHLRSGDSMWLRYDSTSGTTFIRLQKLGRDSFKLRFGAARADSCSLSEAVKIISEAPELKNALFLKIDDAL
ncbi:MAG: hypothetical protein ACYC7D_09060 [Nitrososphaerales archaeon]